MAVVDAHRLIVQVEISGDPPVILTAESGSFSTSWTEINWSLSFGVPSGSVSLTGSAIDLDIKFVVALGSFTLTGTDAYLEARTTTEIVCDPGSFSLLESVASSETILGAVFGDISLSGTIAKLVRVLKTETGAFLLTGSPLDRLYAFSYNFTLSNPGANLGLQIKALSGEFSLVPAKIPRLYGMATNFEFTGTDAQLNDESAVPWLPGFRYRHRIIVDGDEIPEALTHFPIPMPITDSSGKTDKDMTQVFDIMGVDGVGFLSKRKKIAVTESDGTTQLYVDIWGWGLLDYKRGDPDYVRGGSSYSEFCTASSYNITYPPNMRSYPPRSFQGGVIDNYGWRTTDTNASNPDGSCWLKVNYGHMFAFKRMRMYAIMENYYDNLNSFPKDIGFFTSMTGAFTGEETHVGDYTLTQPADGNQPCDWIDFGEIQKAIWFKIEVYSQQNVPNHSPSDWVGIANIEFDEIIEVVTLMVSRSDFSLTANQNNYLYFYYDPKAENNTSYVGDHMDEDTAQQAVWAPHFHSVYPWINPWSDYQPYSLATHREVWEVTDGTVNYATLQSLTMDGYFEMGRCYYKAGSQGSSISYPTYEADMFDSDKDTYFFTLKYPPTSFPFEYWPEQDNPFGFRNNYTAFFRIRAWGSNKLETQISTQWEANGPKVVATIEPDVVYRMALVWDNPYVSLYQNGELLGTAGPCTLPTDSFTSVLIARATGNRNDAYAHNFQLAPGVVLADGWFVTDAAANTDQLLTWKEQEDIRKLKPGRYKLDFYERHIVYGPPGSFEITGTDVLLNIKCSVESGAHSLTGSSVDLDTRFNLVPGTVDLIGTAAYLEMVYPGGFTADPGVYSIAGDITSEISLNVAADDYDITGADISFQHTMNTVSVLLAIEGFDLPRVFAESENYTFSGTDATLMEISYVVAEAGFFDLQETKIYRCYAISGSFGITDFEVDFYWGVSVYADPGNFSLTGSEARFNWMPSFSDHFNLEFPDIRFQVSVNEVPGIANYVFTLTGAENETTDIEIPISSFQATLRSGSATYLRAIVPGVSQATNIIERKDGRMLIDLVYRQMGGSIIHRETIIEANLEDIRYDEKFNNKFIGLVGYKQKTFVKKSIVLQEPSVMRSTNQAHQHYEFPNINVYLKPGDEVIIGEDVFDVHKIDFFINSDNAKMEVFAA